MQIVEIELSHSNFYCPVTGEVILNEKTPPMNEDAKSLMGYWISEVVNEPSIKNDVLYSAWKAFQNEFSESPDGDTPDYDDLEEFLKRYESPTWVVFSITNTGFGHGIQSSTVWYVIDMETKKTN